MDSWPCNTVKPVLRGPVLNGHPLLNGRGHLLQSPSEGISIVFTCIKRSLHKRKPYEHALHVVILVIKSSLFLTNDIEILKLLL